MRRSDSQPLKIGVGLGQGRHTDVTHTNPPAFRWGVTHVQLDTGIIVYFLQYLFRVTHLPSAQHNTAQHYTAQHSTSLHSTALHSTTQHNTTQHSTAQHNTAHGSNRLAAWDGGQERATEKSLYAGVGRAR
ncbi:hypothetical protein Pmani_027547 [Petrolisthes manimaculis]|uniref:Uncharacterized protein n=1 Tax=Petrolisthes manimaculis TaxID=1843537 RepID=A0AAE1P2G9_9EUCA|nr:hypothetical protein Pmani_027547 [Petrolisthes manimaculis]